MIHNLHIVLGINAEQNISRIKEYVIKYGDEYVDKSGEKASDYLRLMLYADDGGFYFAEKRENNNNIFVSGIEDKYAVELVKDGIGIREGSIKEIQGFFKRLFSNTVNMQYNGGNTLHVCIHIPLIDAAAWEHTQMLMRAMEATGTGYSIDLMLTAADLAHLYIDDPTEIALNVSEHTECADKLLNDIVSKKQSGEFAQLNNILLISNINKEGIAINLTTDSYASLMGEYALATTANYDDIFTTTFQLSSFNKYPILGLGMSMIHFDRYHFVQYMLHRAYAYILNREGVNQEVVDIDKVAPIAQELLKPNIKLFTTLYENEVRPRLEKQMSYDDIMKEIKEIIDSEMQRLENEFLSFFNDDNLTLPEKRATLAQLMGEDDALLVGDSYLGENQHIIDECREEVLDIFVKANNELSATYTPPSTDENGNPMEVDEIEDSDPIHGYAAISKEPGERIMTAHEHLKAIKEKKLDIKRGTTYIRQKTEELKLLGDTVVQEDNSHKRLTKDGFQFEGRTYYLMPKDIERPLEENYESTNKSHPKQVDLRQQFTRIKDQGTFGTCAAFTIVSIYEHILKKNNNQDIDLSELFAYHNARKRMEDEYQSNEGTSLYHMVKSIGEDGICLEKLHPYRDADDQEPSKEAYEDARTRKITKALNVACNIDHIKSALADGYPVAISLRIFESFATPTGFVPYPSEEEKNSTEDGAHGMVICGYIDDDRLFIVRNSWGERFGDKGYCYIPYSYIGDDTLLCSACIITEISMAEIIVEGKVVTVAPAFNVADAQVQAALLKNKIAEEEQNQRILTAELSDLRRKYSELVVDLGQPRRRDQVRIGREKLFDKQIEELKERRKSLDDERLLKRDNFDNGTRRIWICTGFVALGLFICYTLLHVYLNHPADESYLMTWGVLNTLQVGGVLAFVAALWLGGRSIEYLSGERYDNYIRRQESMWKWWGISTMLIVIAYVMLSLYKVIAAPFPLSATWQIVLMIMAYVPFAYTILARVGVSKMIEKDYDDKIDVVNDNLIAVEKERDQIKMKMHIAGRIIDSTTSLIAGMSKKNSCVRSYVENLRIWYKENSATQPSEPMCRLPFMSLANNKCLDNYFAQYADELTADIRLHALFRDGYEVGDNDIIAFKNNLKLQLEQTLWNRVSDFSIYDHVTERRTFGYVNHEFVDIDKLLQDMDRNSEIFIRTRNRISNANTMNVCLKLIFHENDADRSWDNSINTNFATRPTAYDLASKYKVFIVRLEGLSMDEVVM